MGLTPVPASEIATIVTTLQMTRRPRLRPTPASTLRLVPWERPSLAQYRTLFARVGTPWLWFSRLVMADAPLDAILADPAIKVFAVADVRGIEVGMVELDFRVTCEAQIAYFGLVSELTRQGHGRWLMAETLARAWCPGVTRVWVHTCTLDHASALGFYRAQGFAAVSRTIETFADPRVSGVLPADAAPHIPCLCGQPAIRGQRDEHSRDA